MTAVPLPGAARVVAIFPRSRLGTVPLFAIVAIVAYLLAKFAVREEQNNDFETLFPLLLGAVVCCYGFAKSLAADGVSLRVMFWYYNALFMAIAPIAQYFSGIWIFGLDDTWVRRAAWLALLHYAVFALAYPFGRRAGDRVTPPADRVRVLLDGRVGCLAVVSAVVVAWFVSRVGVMFQQSMVIAVFGGTYSPVSMLSEFFLRPFVFFVFLVSAYRLRYARGSLVSTFALAVSAGAVALFMGPLSAARFFVFALYFGLTIMLFPPIGGRRAMYGGLLFLGLFGSDLYGKLAAVIADDSGTASLTGFSADYFYAGHFDGFENLAHSMRYVADNGPTWGNQMLGALLFWIPREWWPTKPVGSGGYIATSYLAVSDNAHINIAAPLIEEAYLNFALPGVIIVFLLAGYGSGRADALFRRHAAGLKIRGRTSASAILGGSARYVVFYPVVVGLSIFLFRGDFLSGFAFASGFATSFTVVYLLATEWRRLPASSP